MGIYLQPATPLVAWRRRAASVGLLAVLHVVVIAGLVKMDVIRPDKPVQEKAVEVVFLDEVRAPPPRVTPPELERPVVASMPVPQVVVMEEAPAAITVVRQPVTEAIPEPVAQGPVSVDEVEYLRRVSPRYPVAAKRAGAQGVVYLRVLIDVEGRPAEVRIHRSSGSEQLDAAASEAVWKFQFRPHRVGGVARTALAIIPVQFSLSRNANRRSEETDASSYTTQVASP